MWASREDGIVDRLPARPVSARRSGRSDERLGDGAQPVRPLGVAGRGEVLEEDVVGDEERGQFKLRKEARRPVVWEP